MAYDRKKIYQQAKEAIKEMSLYYGLRETKKIRKRTH